jgi:hypothetical protein
MNETTILLGEVADHIRSVYHPDRGAVIDTWTDFDVTLAEFRPLVLSCTLPQAQAHGVRSWIVDTTRASGVLLPDVQAFLAEEVVPAMIGAGIERLINVMPRSSLAKMAVQRYARIESALDAFAVATLAEALAEIPAITD